MKPMPRVGYQPLYLLFLLCCLSTALRAQETMEIKGKIIDRETKAPIPFCAVALSGTSLGAITGEDGRYIISNVPKQAYQIIASHIAYSNKVVDLNPEYPKTSYNMSLIAKVMELEEVAIESRGRGKVGRLRRRNLDRFKKLLFGEIYDNDLIAITNQEVLDLTEKMNKSIVSNKTYDLEIENDFLGYDLVYLNLSFSLSDKGKSFVGFPTFKPKTAENDAQKKQWMKNREVAYRGSLEHFFVSLISNTLDEENFIANLTNDNPSERKPTSFKKKTTQVNTKGTKRRAPNVLIEFNEAKELYEISFQDVIEVFFMREDGTSGHSFLKKQTKKIEVYPTGVLRNPLSVVVYGDLANRGVYYMLPSNYRPQN